MRLLGIHTMGRLLQDSPRDQVAIVEGLSQFIRDHSASRHQPNPDDFTVSGPPIDVQRALDALASVPKSGCSKETRWSVGQDLSDGQISLFGADLSDANIVAADLTCVDLSGANLTGAHLDGANPDGAASPVPI